MTDSENGITTLPGMETRALRAQWRKFYRTEPPIRLSRDLLIRGIAHQIQERTQGGLTQSTKRKLRTLARKLKAEGHASFAPGLSLKPGAMLVRGWHSRTHTVIVLEDGFQYDGRRYRSLTKIAREITGAHWSGPRFFGLKDTKPSIERTEGVT